MASPALPEDSSTDKMVDCRIFEKCIMTTSGGCDSGRHWNGEIDGLMYDFVGLVLDEFFQQHQNDIQSGTTSIHIPHAVMDTKSYTITATSLEGVRLSS